MRILLVGLLLWFARAWAARFLATPKARAYAPLPDAERLARYAPVALGAKLGLDPCFTHETVAATPPEDRYPPLVLVPKLAVMAALALPLRTDRRFASIEEASRLAVSFGPPRALAERWDRDECFATLRLQGPNPAWIRRDSVTGATYSVNYRELLRGLPTAPGRYMAPCAALFRSREGRLETVGIVLERPDGTPMLARPDGSPGWQLAKMFFGNAEILVHEALSHFLWTHMVGERLILATRRHLPDDHPVSRLLSPHAHFTLQANENSGSRLLGPDGFFERCFSAGWEGTRILLERGLAMFRFEQLVLPWELASREVDEIRDYPYRDDALPVWAALERYATSAIGLAYADDAAVAADGALATWAAAFEGPRPADRAALATVVTAILFTTVQHSLVNAMQFDAYAWPGLFPATIRTPLPDSLAEVTPGHLVAALPTVQQTLDAMRATASFSIQFNVLAGDLERFLPADHAPLVARLRAELGEASRAIEARNRGRPWRYDVAMAARLSNSINA